MMTFDATELPKLEIESLYDMWITPSGRLYAGGWVGLFVFDEGAWRACAVRGRNVVKSLTGHEETVWALLARGSVVRTEDGERWKSAKAMRKNNSSSVITTDGVHLVGHDSTFSQITTSDDGGESFTTHARDGYSMSSPRVSGVPSGFVVRGKQFEGIGLSTDHGRTWVSTTYEASIYFRTVHATDTHAFVIDGETVQRWTHDLSEAKTVLTLDREAAAMDSTAAGRVVIAGHRGLLVVSEDHGETWEYVDVGSGIDLTGVRLHGDEILVHDGSGRILRGTLSEASSEASTEDVVAGTVEVLHEAFEDFEEHDISASWPRPDQHPYAPNALTFVGDERLVSSDPSGRLLMWSVRDGQWGFESMLVPAGNERAQHLASSGDSVWLVGDDGVRVVDVTSGGVETVCDLSESHHTQIRYDGLLVVDGQPLAHANRSLITFSERERTHHALEAAVSGQLDPQIQYVEHDALLDALVVSTTTGAVQFHSPTTFEPTGGFSARSGLAFALEDTARVGVARMGTPNWSTPVRASGRGGTKHTVGFDIERTHSRAGHVLFTDGIKHLAAFTHAGDEVWRHESRQEGRDVTNEVLSEGAAHLAWVSATQGLMVSALEGTAQLLDPIHEVREREAPYRILSKKGVDLWTTTQDLLFVLTQDGDLLQVDLSTGRTVCFGHHPDVSDVESIEYVDGILVVFGGEQSVGVRVDDGATSWRRNVLARTFPTRYDGAIYAYAPNPNDLSHSTGAFTKIDPHTGEETKPFGRKYINSHYFPGKTYGRMRTGPKGIALQRYRREPTPTFWWRDGEVEDFETHDYGGPISPSGRHRLYIEESSHHWELFEREGERETRVAFVPLAAHAYGSTAGVVSSRFERVLTLCAEHACVCVYSLDGLLLERLSVPGIGHYDRVSLHMCADRRVVTCCSNHGIVQLAYA